jgi:hypothetical protein
LQSLRPVRRVAELLSFGESMNLPADVTSYLEKRGSRTGELPDFPLWFEIWPVEEMDQWS